MLGWVLNVIARILPGRVTTEEQCYTAGFDDGGKGHKPRDAALEAAEDEDVCLLAPPEVARPADAWVWAQGT